MSPVYVLGICLGTRRICLSRHFLICLVDMSCVYVLETNFYMSCVYVLRICLDLKKLYMSYIYVLKPPICICLINMSCLFSVYVLCS